MPAISAAKAMLRVIGDDLNPDEISHKLGCVPTRSYSKGDDLSKSGFGTKPRFARSGLWALEAKKFSPGDINSQLNQLLAEVTNDLSIWEELANLFQLSVLCAWFMDGGNEGEDFSVDVLKALSERKIELSIDIFGD